MTGKKFINSLANNKKDIIQLLLDILEELDASYCIVGGLAVNAYVEPVVSLDLDIVIGKKNIDDVCKLAESKGLRVKHFEHSINLSSPLSDLRIQLQTDPRYQEFLDNAELKEILGYKMQVASLEDVLKGKVWAYSDETRRKSKRQKDLADIMRLVESYPELESHLPSNIRKDLR